MWIYLKYLPFTATDFLLIISLGSSVQGVRGEQGDE